MPYLYVETAGQKLCQNGRLPSGEACREASVPAALGSLRGTLSHTGDVRLVYPDESTDALIYISVVMVFYIAIILMLVLSNISRCRQPDAEADENGAASAEKRRLVAHVGKKSQVQQSVLQDGPQCAECCNHEVATV